MPNEENTTGPLTEAWDYKGVSEWIHLADRKPSVTGTAEPAPTADDNEMLLARAYDPTVIAQQTAAYHRELEAKAGEPTPPAL